jgi:hypothetical protein
MIGSDRGKMATTAKKLTALSDEELGEMLELLHGADSTELKLTLPEALEFFARELGASRP